MGKCTVVASPRRGMIRMGTPERLVPAGIAVIPEKRGGKPGEPRVFYALTTRETVERVTMSISLF